MLFARVFVAPENGLRVSVYQLQLSKKYAQRAGLIAFAFALTRVDSAFAGRAYAAYGGIYTAASLFWLWAVEDQPPTRTDLIGAALAVVGALVIIGFAERAR